MSDAVLTDAEIEAALHDLADWRLDHGRLHRELAFADFNEAFGFMVRVALIAEARDHHPDWSNSWNKVVIDIVNHAAGGITARCVALAEAIEALRT